jgi:hypothetical protein
MGGEGYIIPADGKKEPWAATAPACARSPAQDPQSGLLAVLSYGLHTAGRREVKGRLASFHSASLRYPPVKSAIE